MATFQLKDGFGLNVTVTPGDSALSKYFQNLPDWIVSTIDLAQVAGQDLTNPAVSNAQSGLSFSQPISIGTSPAVDLTVGASASGSLSIFVPESDGARLFDPELFGDNITVAANQRYVSVGLTAAPSASASASLGDLSFGFDGESDVKLAYYELFTAGTTVLAAVKDTVTKFSIPGDLDDIAAMPTGSVATAEGSGDLKFSGSVNLLSVTNPLATATVPLLGSIGVSGGAAVAVGADYEFSGDYQIRVQKLTATSFRLGFYRKRTSEFDFSASANASLTANLGDSDLFVELMQAISSDPAGDLAQLEAAGLSEDQSEAIQSAITSAVNRTLEIGVSLELSRTDESDAMFLYEVDVAALQPDGRSLVNSALKGNLSGLVKTDTNPPAGVKVIRTLLSRAKTFQHSLKVNLLGIYNVLQLSKLMIQGTAAWDATTGELVLTDQIAADKITVITSNLQVKDSAKLRKILAQHFLITAAYRAAAANVVGPPDLTGLQTYFDLEQNPGANRVRDYFSVPVALGLETKPVAEANIPKNIDEFGKTTVYAEAGYNNAAFRSLFFAGAALDRGVYIRAGLQAIQNLVAPGDPDDFRLILANSVAFFDQLEGIGAVSGPQFAEACVNQGIPANRVPVVGTDFLNVVFLADAMQSAGQKLQAIDQFLANNPSIDPSHHNFQQLKKQLADALGKVAQQATTDFGGPWGFEAMALLGKSSSQKWLLVNRFITSALPPGQTPPLRVAAAGGK